jgi:H+/Cl- antiporter ClcA
MKSRFARRSRHVWLSQTLWNRRLLFLLGAVIVGLVCVGFAIAASYANQVFQQTVQRAWWAPLLIAPIGFCVVRWMTLHWFAGTQGSGIPQTIAALRIRGAGEAGARQGLLSLRVAFGKVLLTVAGLFSGASIGREGPSVQVGAAVMFSLSRFTAFSSEGMRRGLIQAGGAAGIAAAFNAPLAGVVFAIEEMSRSFEQRTTSIVITAVITAGIVALALQGNYAYFGQTHATLELHNGWLAVVLCGSVGGLLGGAFSRLLLSLSQTLPGWLGGLRSSRPALFAGLCGLALALIGLASGNTIYGTGYDEAQKLIVGGDTAHSFGLLKLMATLVSYVSGIPGGIFAPSLAIGAGLGHNIAALLPSAADLPLASVVILGMVGYFSGVVQAPITAFVIVIEMTRDSEMALPLMTCSLLAYALSRMVCPTPLYKGLAKSFLKNDHSSHH